MQSIIQLFCNANPTEMENNEAFDRWKQTYENLNRSWSAEPLIRVEAIKVCHFKSIKGSPHKKSTDSSDKGNTLQETEKNEPKLHPHTFN